MIGRFAGLSCADVVNITSYYNGTKYSYVMYKNGSGINIDKLSEAHDVNFKNGLEVSLDVNAYYREISKAIDRLVLFDTLHIEYVDKSKGYSYDNELVTKVNKFNSRKIIHYKTFSVSDALPSSRYLSVGNILYDNEGYDWDNFSTSNGIIVDIPIGEVDITPNREELQFTDRTKEAIKRHINKVKAEFQELINEIQSKDFTLQEFYKYSTDREIAYEKDGYKILINKEDITIDTSHITINNYDIPDGFVKVIREVKNAEIEKKNIYKIFNSGNYYKHRRLVKGNIFLDCILDNAASLGVKKDSIIKSSTVAYYETLVGSTPNIVIYDLEKLEAHIKNYLVGSVPSTQIKECVDFLFDRLNIFYLSNDIVPQSFLDSYKISRKKVKSAEEQDKITVRIYSGRSTYNEPSYTMDTLDRLPTNSVVIYSENTRDATTICEVSKLLRYISTVTVITLKKEYFPILEANKKYILLDDFLELPNTILKKLVTARIIERNFNAVKADAMFRFNELPIVKEFHKKYREFYTTVDYGLSNSKFILNLLDKYEAKGWYNKADVEYFKIDSTDEEALRTIINLQEQREQVLKSIAFFMFGKNTKIGITTPKINICKYLRKFKYECI